MTFEMVHVKNLYCQKTTWFLSFRNQILEKIDDMSRNLLKSVLFFVHYAVIAEIQATNCNIY